MAISSFAASAGVTTGSFADVLGIELSIEGAPGLYTGAHLKDRRRGAIAKWYLGTAAGPNRSLALRGSQHQPLFFDPQGRVPLVGVSATTASFAGRMAAIADRDGTGPA